MLHAAFLLFILVHIKCGTGYKQDPRREFYQYASVQPTIYTAERQDLQFIDDVNEEEVTVDFKAFNKNFIVNLRMNKNLLSKNYFEKYQGNEDNIVLHPLEQKNGKHCHYQGYVEGFNNSWAALSLCKGVSGVIYNGEELHFIEPDHRSDVNNHFVFKGSDLKSRNARCGVKDEQENNGANQHLDESFKMAKSKNLKIPYIRNEEPLIVEVLYVISQAMYAKYGARMASRSQQIANIVNAVYAPQNILVALIGIEIWDREDKIDITSDGDETLNAFLKYRKEHLMKEHPNDNAVLFTDEEFDGGVVGKAYMGVICKDDFSAEVVVDQSSNAGEPALTTAHEMGHNFGMPHDGSNCQCPSGEGNCIMTPIVVTPPPTKWTDCSLKYLQAGIKAGSDYCMKNKPARVEGPICGNGFVEDGEQCDCGPKELCNNRCCNAATCRLAANAVCATGRCCDIQTCQMKRAGSICRSKISNCDLPEFCDRSSEFCPEDVYRQNGAICGTNNEGHCYKGKCRSHEEQCKLLWGPEGKVADPKCYEENTKGDRNFNCGFLDKASETFKPCPSQDAFCGRLQCVDLNKNLTFGSGVDSRKFEGHVLINNSWYKCRTAVIDLGVEPDPGLSPDGAKCGDGKACLNQRCVPLSNIKTPDCPGNCNAKGTCNSKGHCHCNQGFAPPDCRNPGRGGSIDSGPAS